jgi:hypothetical protein
MKKSIYSSKIISDEEYYREKEQLRNATRDALIEGKPRQLFAQLMAALTVLLSIFFLYPDWIFVAIYAVIFGVTLYLAAFLLGPLLFSFIWIFEWLIIVTLDGNIKWTENLFYSFLGLVETAKSKWNYFKFPIKNSLGFKPKAIKYLLKNVTDLQRL